MSAPSPPADNSMQIRQMEIEEARRREEADKVAKEQRKQELSGLRSNARNAASGSARDYFTQRGIDSSQYGSDIENALNNILSGIDPEETNPGQYFRDAGQNIYTNLEAASRTRANDSLDRIFGQNYDTRRIPFSLDDPYLQSIEAEQYQSADDIIRNMMDRGVLTGAGATSARADLERQRASVRSRLNEYGTGVLSSGQQGLRDIANRARETAGGLRLGQNFDVNQYQSDADSYFDNFLSTLGDQIRSRISGPMFATAGLGAIGGAGQGAGNGAYNPKAVAGIFDQGDEERTNNNPTSTDSIF